MITVCLVEEFNHLQQAIDGILPLDPPAFDGDDDRHDAEPGPAAGYDFQAVTKSLLLRSLARPLVGWAKSQKYRNVCRWTRSSRASSSSWSERAPAEEARARRREPAPLRGVTVDRSRNASFILVLSFMSPRGRPSRGVIGAALGGRARAGPGRRSRHRLGRRRQAGAQAGPVGQLDDVQHAVPEAIRGGIAAEADQGAPGELPLEDREHEPAVVLVERAGRIVEEHPARRVQQQARERQALLLVERQLPVPALGAVERGRKVAEIHPLERGLRTAASSKRPGSAG